MRCTKPGTGTVDAPRAFSLKLKGITQGDEGGLYPALHDAELEMRHVHQKLIVLITTHVDDLKMLGEADEVDRLIRMLEKHYGRCTQTNDYGLHQYRHSPSVPRERCDDGSVCVHQNLEAYTAPSMIGLAADKEVIEEVKSLFASLVGAIAYSLMTQSWVAVYIVALQRQLQRPLAIHVRRLNAVLRKMQQRPRPVFFAAME